jgi:nitrite reductase/ring-hydroxylating ferredoxin subunit
MPMSADCGGCELAAASRRAFIREMAMAAVGMLAVSALRPAEALAGSAMVVEPLGSGSGRLQRKYALPTSDVIQVDVDNEVIIARWQDRVYAFSTRCPHKGATLRWLDDEQKIFCPKHKARFGRDGAHLSGRGTRALHRYDISREGNSIVVNLETELREDADAAAWKAAVIVL